MYVLYGLIAPETLLDGVRVPDANGPIRLEAGLAVMAIASTAETPTREGFYALSEPVEQAAAEASKRGRVAYVEAEFFGGWGTQAALGWERDAVAFGPLLTCTPGSEGSPWVEVETGEDMAINEVLRWLGLARREDLDEFGTAGLASRRDWREPLS